MSRPDVAIGGATQGIVLYSRANPSENNLVRARFIAAGSPLGQPCASAGECGLLQCVEGVCCDGPCNGVCESCRAANTGAAEGHCGPELAGIDVHDQCPDDGVASCARDGLCDGAGACRIYPVGTACGPAFCTGTELHARQCDASRQCLGGVGTACEPFACSGSACTTTCSTTTDCAPDAFCQNGTCVPRRPAGDKCTSNDDCASTFCANGVCCNTKCDHQCEACDRVDHEGTCVAVVGPAPAGRTPCAAGEPGAPCSGRQCDGTVRNECVALAGAEVSCRAATCNQESALTLAASCDGTGTCPAAVRIPCAPFACRDDACTTSCASDADCAAQAKCNPSTKKCVSEATCNNHVVTKPDGSTLDCSPFKCDSSGQCIAKCATVDDCVAPLVCDVQGACVSPDATSTSKGCGCEVAGSSGDEARGIALALALAIALGRRQSRRDA